MIIAMTGQKGGTGKTTLTLNLACEWHARGRRVLVVDADPQGSASRFADIARAAGQAIPHVVAMGPSLHRPDQLPSLAGLYDVVLIDAPPRLDEVQRAALMVCDLAVLPCGPAAVETWALPGMLEYVSRAQRIRSGMSACLLVSRIQPRTRLGASIRQRLQRLGLPVLESEICQRTVYQESIGSGVGVTQYAPVSAAAAEVRYLAGELEGVYRRRYQTVAA